MIAILEGSWSSWAAAHLWWKVDSVRGWDFDRSRRAIWIW